MVVGSNLAGDATGMQGPKGKRGQRGPELTLTHREWKVAETSQLENDPAKGKEK